MLTPRVQPAAPRRVSPGAAQNSGLQLAPGAPPPAPQSGFVPVLARCAARPHLSAAVVVALAAPRALRSRPRIPRASKAAPARPERRRVAVLSPYFPYPLAHGGAVRIYHLLREIAREFDVELFAFTDDAGQEPDTPPRCWSSAPAWCWWTSRAIASRAGPRCCRPKCTSSARPPCARRSPKSAAPSASSCCRWNTRNSAPYGGDILVEHDVTFDLFGQIARRERTLAAWWDFFRWRRFETRAVSRYRRVVVMSPEGRRAAGPAAFPPRSSKTAWTWSAFQPQPEQPGQRLLFIGSFRHFPNVDGLSLLHRTRLAAAARASFRS